jgi:hypothetical protein
LAELWLWVVEVVAAIIVRLLITVLQVVVVVEVVETLALVDLVVVHLALVDSKAVTV